MAEQETGKENGDVEAAEVKKGSTKKLLVIVVINVVVILASIGATMYFTGALSSAQATTNTAAADGHKEKSAGPKKEAIYKALEPPFVVNIQGDENARFLQIAVEVMARDQDVIDAVEKHDARIRNDLILLFSSQTSAALSNREGKEKLRDEGLKTIQKILKDETGQPGIEKIYFTSMVMQ